eukprot:superscaffoldBa00000037_g671
MEGDSDCQEEDDTPLTLTIKEGILNYLNEKYDDRTTEELLDMASLVDPWFKTRYIKDEWVDYMKARATAELESLVAKQAASTEAAPLPSASAATDEPEVPAKRQKKSLSSYFKTAAKQSQIAPQSSRGSIEKELNLYLQTVEAAPETN